MFAPKSTFASSFARLVCTGIALLSWTPRPCLAQGQTTHTAADFESARTTAEAALANARKALRQNATLRATAEDAAARLTTLAQSRDTGSTTEQNLIEINSILQPLVPPASATAITAALTQAAASLNDSKSGVTSNQTQLTSLKGSDDFRALDPDSQDRFSQTLLDCGTVLDQISKDDGLNSDSNNKLKAALGKVLAQAIGVTGGFTKAIKPLTDLGDVTPPGTDDQKKAVLKTTGKYLPVYADIICRKERYSVQWTGVSTNLKTLDSSIDPSPVLTNLGKFDEDPVSKIPTFLPHWLEVVKQMPSAETVKLEQLIVVVDSDAPANTASAVSELQTANTLQDSFKGVDDSWNKLLSSSDCLGEAGVPLSSDAVTASLAAFGKDSHAMFGALSRLQEAIAGDFSDFEADQQQLFYFTDVSRLMKMLNPDAHEIGGIEGAQEQAEAARHKLAQAELDVAAAQADVSTYQTRLMQLPEELKQARAEARQQDSVYGKTSNRLANLTDKLSAASSKVDSLKNAPATTSATANQKNQNDLTKAQQDKDRLTAQTADAQRDNASAQHDKDVADQKLKAAEDEQNGIPAQMEKAKRALQAAQTAVSQRRQESLLAAQSESDAFALARDNTPYWFAPATGISKDAARRVEMYGTNDSKIIYMRGKRADLDGVKDIIAGIDRPAPQARVTLWSLQLNYTNDKSAGQRANQALYQVEDRLAEIRTRLATSASLLRNAVSDTVNHLAQGSCAGPATSDDCRISRITLFYNRQVLLRLGYDPTNLDYTKAITRWTIPDPVGTTTLGEALMVLSLAKPGMRRNVMADFKRRIALYDKNWNCWHPTGAGRQRCKHRKEFLVPADFVSLTRALDIETDEKAALATEEHSELTSAQLEIVRALESLAYQTISGRLISLSKDLHRIRQLLTPDCRELGVINKSLGKPQTELCSDIPSPVTLLSECPMTDAPCLNALRTVLTARVYDRRASSLTISDRMKFLLFYLLNNYGVAIDFRLLADPSNDPELDCDPDEATCYEQFAAKVKRTLLGHHPLTTATPREAAADEMLKELMTAMEEDLDRIFIRPGLADLRADLSEQGSLQVGILQRTSVLATNRLVARVDPRSSAQLALGDQEDILQSVNQLAQIYMAAQTGGALGTLSALNNLKSQSEEPPQEIYGITTGSTFKVTPIFDPSGQALRFKFDYVAANNITEPNGTMNPQLPRIERHTVNTEVQISSMEIREISRYEANSKLGLPTKFWGGIPIIKDIIQEIPGARPYFPLLGWFVRKGGSGAASQESLLFGQTVIYPTIGDISELLTGSGNGGGTGTPNLTNLDPSLKTPK